MNALRNRWFALRHGRSEANEQGIVVSHPDNGVPRFGLSEAGRREALERLAPGRLGALGLTRGSTLVVTSDFRRARETAEVLCERNGLDAPVLDRRLRERFFGELELGPAATGYASIWARDRESPDHHDRGCESVVEVRARFVAAVEDLERAHEGRAIVLVSHGDPLQILETWFAGRAASEHRLMPHLETAELRALLLAR